jgi:hypothetical protein
MVGGLWKVHFGFVSVVGRSLPSGGDPAQQPRTQKAECGERAQRVDYPAADCRLFSIFMIVVGQVVLNQREDEGFIALLLGSYVKIHNTKFSTLLSSKD